MLRERAPGARTRGKQLVAVVPPASRTPQNAVPGTASHLRTERADRVAPGNAQGNARTTTASARPSRWQVKILAPPHSASSLHTLRYRPHLWDSCYLNGRN